MTRHGYILRSSRWLDRVNYQSWKDAAAATVTSVILVLIRNIRNWRHRRRQQRPSQRAGHKALEHSGLRSTNIRVAGNFISCLRRYIASQRMTRFCQKEKKVQTSRNVICRSNLMSESARQVITSWHSTRDKASYPVFATWLNLSDWCGDVSRLSGWVRLYSVHSIFSIKSMANDVYKQFCTSRTRTLKALWADLRNTAKLICCTSRSNSPSAVLIVLSRLTICSGL
jgi:hypothetical protein